MSGAKTVVDCVVDINGGNLTDKNIKPIPNKKPVADVFNDVFGDEFVERDNNTT